MTSAGTLRDLLTTLPDHGDRPAIFAVTGGEMRTWSYAELEDHAMRVAGGLLAEGVEPGEPIAIFAENRPEWVVVRLALIAVGALAVPLDYLLTEKQLARAIADSGCRRIFATSDLLPATCAAEAKLAAYLLDRDEEAAGARSWRSLLAARPDSLPPIAPDDVVALFYTSGTTGMPKGVPLTHRNIATNVNSILSLNVVGRGDRVLLPLPLHHSYPFIVGMLIPLSSGASMVLPEGVTGPEVVGALKLSEATLVVGVPRLYEAMLAGIEAKASAQGGLKATLFRTLLSISTFLRDRFGVGVGRVLFGQVHAGISPKLRTLVSGGARLEPEVARRLEGLGWTVLSGYGLVETASISTFNPPGRARLESVGMAAPGVEVRIDSPDDEGRGEVVMRGPTVFAGYRNDPEANRAAFTDDGWFRSGDIGRLDADGYLSIEGRIKELIVLPDGKNVAPEEVEAVYGESPYVREAAVLELNGALVALVAPDIETLRETGTGRIEHALRVSLGEMSLKLPPYKRISGYAVTRETLPRTRLGKYQRHLLPEIYARAERGESAQSAPLTDDDRRLLATPRGRQVWHWLEGRYPDHSLNLDTSPQLDLAIDSLAWVTIGLELEEKFGFSLTEESVSRVVTLRDLLREVDAAPEAARTSAAEQEAPAVDFEHWLAPTGRIQDAIQLALHIATVAVAKVFFRLRVVGADHLPAKGPLVVVPNHVSDLDTLIMFAALPWGRLRETYWGGDTGRLFGSSLRRYLSRAIQVFPVDDRTPTTSLAYGAEVLRRGNILVWFPEEWRSPTGELQPFLPGIGRLIEESGAPAIPVFIGGTFEAMPRHHRLPRLRPVSVIFGAPRDASSLLGATSGEDRHTGIATALHDAVADLAGGRDDS